MSNITTPACIATEAIRQAPCPACKGSDTRPVCRLADRSWAWRCLDPACSREIYNPPVVPA